MKKKRIPKIEERTILKKMPKNEEKNDLKLPLIFRQFFGPFFAIFIFFSQKENSYFFRSLFKKKFKFFSISLNFFSSFVKIFFPIV